LDIFHSKKNRVSNDEKLVLERGKEGKEREHAKVIGETASWDEEDQLSKSDI